MTAQAWRASENSRPLSHRMASSTALYTWPLAQVMSNQFQLTAPAQGADVNEKCCEGCRALHPCANLDDALMIGVLLEEGPSNNVKDGSWRTLP